MPRESQTTALLGPEVYRKVRETPILVVGAGGIGCELRELLPSFFPCCALTRQFGRTATVFELEVQALIQTVKNLVLVGFANIEIIDLDTIDLSNLNRQFLFRKPDIKKSKSLVASASARHFNPDSGIKIHARHGNVKDSGNDLEWIKGFGLVLNALDNRDARSHVNRLCQAGGVPLIESGTAGYLGQVTPFIKDRTECFDCEPKPGAQKTYPVCTLRATPSEPIHCIVWAKSYLFGKLFGEDDEAGDDEELNQAAAEGENAEEIANLKQEAAAFREVRQNMGVDDGPRKAFDKVFKDDINRLLAMDDLWNKEGRVKPYALDYDQIMAGSFPTPPLRNAAAVAAAAAAPIAVQSNGTSNGAAGTNGDVPAPDANNTQLKDQRELSLKENLELLVDSCRRLSARAIAHPEAILSFDKDDDDTLDFVLTTSNLRSAAYGIPQKTRFQVKEMAGNIIPAIATTNAIVAGFIVMSAIRLLSGDEAGMRKMYLKTEPTRPIAGYGPNGPNKFCGVCRDVYVPFKADVKRVTVGQMVEEAVQGWLAKGVEGGEGGEEVEWEVYEGGRLLADPDFDDLHGQTLEQVGVERGKMITVLGERSKADGSGMEAFRPVHLCVCELSPNSEKSYELPEVVPSIPLAPVKAVPRAPTPDFEVMDDVVGSADFGVAAAGKKRAAEDDAEGGQEGKRRKVEVVVADYDDDFEIV